VDKIKLEILGLSPSQQQTGSFALVLGEEFGSRRLPIIIGMFEAQAIAIEIEKIQPNRPMTHDLFKSFAKAFNYTIKEVVISDLREGIFFARLFCTDGMRDTVIDTRPSDAIAIALRFDIPIFTFENILSEAGIETVSRDEEEIPESETKPRPVGQHLKNLNLDELNQLLMEALSHEEYERAAKIRDEIERRN
jgi:bifunctional DNase/RNase